MKEYSGFNGRRNTYSLKSRLGKSIIVLKDQTSWRSLGHIMNPMV
jgi:hypothetical protein